MPLAMVFAKGIALVDPTRLEYVLPATGMGKKRLIQHARMISLEDLPTDELQFLKLNKTINNTNVQIPYRLLYERH